MGYTIKRIAVGGWGDFTCYLITTEVANILIDTGTPQLGEALEKGLVDAGCFPGNLKLIILTNGAMDSSGNCAYVREKFGGKIAVHEDDAVIVERPTNLKREWKSAAYAFGNILARQLAKGILAKVVLCKPDLRIDEGFDLAEYGFDAKIIHLPGYTKGSIGILTSEGDFFSGNTISNALGILIQPYMLASYAELNESLDKLKALDIKTVYPLGGKPLPMERVLEELGSRKYRWLRKSAFLPRPSAAE